LPLTVKDGWILSWESPVFCSEVTLVACFRAVTSCDLPWAFVAAWALMGIYRMQTVPDKAGVKKEAIG